MIRAWMSGGAVALCFLVGCSGGHDDCRDPARACEAPFMCEEGPMGESGELGYRCATDYAPAPSCTGTPVDSDLNVSTAIDGVTVHFPSPSDCVPVTYDAAFAGKLAAMEAALDDWNGVSCHQLCLTGPTQADTLPDLERRERRIHFHVTEAQVGNTVPLLSTLFFELSSGRAFGCDVGVDEAFLDAVATGDVLGAIMLCAGFTTTPGLAANTVTAQGEPGSRPESLTTVDESALCALYAASGSYCAEDDSL